MTNPTANIPAKKLERIRSLLAKAEATEYEHEREAFMKAATDQMAKYGVEQAMLDATKKVREKPSNRRVVIEDGQYIDRRSDLASWLTAAMNLKGAIWTEQRRRGKARILHVFGYESDLDRFDMLYTSLSLQMASGLTRVKPPQGEHPRAFRNAWMLGFISKVTAMVKEREKQAVQEAETKTTGTEVVLRDRRMVVEEEFTAAYPKLGKAKKRYMSSAAGFERGQVAGARANLGGTGVENRRAELHR